METTFTPIASSIGGILIGVSATLLMLTLGRIAGATGILAGVLVPAGWRDWSWRAAMIAGMVTAPLVVELVTSQPATVTVTVSQLALAVGGVIVGIGVVFGSGCTSGHGVCGLARFSPRSLVATLTFMASTALTVFVVRHVVGG